MNTKQVGIKVDGITVDPEVIAKNRKKIITLGGMLGGKFFTIGAVETYPNFEQKKRENEVNGALSFMPNRTPRRFAIRDHEVYGQTIQTGVDGTTKVVFNPGSDEEAKATIIDGAANFGETSDEAIGNALTGQKNVIFANGVKLAEKANEYNQAEVDRLNVFIKQLCEQRDAIISTMKQNELKATTYEQEILQSTPKQKVGGLGSSPAIIVQSAEPTDE